MKILFVCTGNTCRSSMAEGIFKKMLKEMGSKYEDIQVISAGISAVNGSPSSEFALKALLEQDVDISEHSATQLSAKMVDEADLILTMTVAHKNMILSIIPEAKEKTYTLKEYSVGDVNLQDNLNISDPYGMPYSRYKECAKEISDSLEKIVNKIQND